MKWLGQRSRRAFPKESGAWIDIRTWEACMLSQQRCGKWKGKAILINKLAWHKYFRELILSLVIHDLCTKECRWLLIKAGRWHLQWCPVRFLSIIDRNPTLSKSGRVNMVRSLVFLYIIEVYSKDSFETIGKFHEILNFNWSFLSTQPVHFVISRRFFSFIVTFLFPQE